VIDNNGCSLVLVLLYLSHSLHYFSYFHHNRIGINHVGLSPTSKVINIEHVKSNFNIRDGILWAPDQGLEVTLNNVEANYNGQAGVSTYTFSSTSTSAAKVILKGVNSVNGNQRDGFEIDAPRGSKGGRMDVVVSRGATLNAYNNAEDGVLVRPDASGSTLTVEKGGAVIACGNGDEPGRITRSESYEDIRGPANVDAFFPTSGKRYTCDSANANGFTCENTCPVCAPN